MLKISNVEVKYSNVILVLKGVSLEVPDEAVVCLLGANGAGKTTLIRAVSGMLKTQLGKVTDGVIEIGGQRVENQSPEVIAALRVAQVMEGRRVLEQLTVEENLKLGGYIGPGGSRLKADLDRVYDYFPRLWELKTRTSGYISGGEQQMVVIGRALMTHPKLMLLDEPSLGLAPLMVKSIYEVLERINREEKTSMLLVEQNARIALSIASYGYIMESGRIVLDGAAEKLKDNEDVKEFYLGLSAVGKKKSYKDVKHYKRRKRWLG
ncbi:MAG: ABC transporter ATP-binding protein [Proteobacteria bacterium]|nr:ABC transporter ATP-binding protein [Pseudomonadota bacterium]